MVIPFLSYAWASTPARLTMAAGVTGGFAVLARAVRGVSLSGAVGGGLACLALFVGAGPGAFATLAALFVATSVSTRLGYRRKRELGLAERQEGRNATQVLANLAVAAAGTVVFGATGKSAWLVAAAAALTEAATDTVASEIGQSRRRDALMITTWQRVPAGVDGGITMAGTLAGLGGGIAIASVATSCGMVARRELWIPIVAGFAGMIVDSLLGATMQRRGWISNEGVNFAATLMAGALGYGMVLVVM